VKMSCPVFAAASATCLSHLRKKPASRGRRRLELAAAYAHPLAFSANGRRKKGSQTFLAVCRPELALLRLLLAVFGIGARWRMRSWWWTPVPRTGHAQLQFLTARGWSIFPGRYCRRPQRIAQPRNGRSRAPVLFAISVISCRPCCGSSVRKHSVTNRKPLQFNGLNRGVFFHGGRAP
jgi:hypothetical protein